MSSPVENRADVAAQKMTSVDLGLAIEQNGENGEHEVNRTSLYYACLPWLAELAESQPQVLKWAPVCSESGVV